MDGVKLKFYGTIFSLRGTGPVECPLNETAWPRASLFRRFADTNVYGTGSVKIWKTLHKISVDTMIFYSVQQSCLHRVADLRASAAYRQ